MTKRNSQVEVYRPTEPVVESLPREWFDSCERNTSGTNVSTRHEDWATVAGRTYLMHFVNPFFRYLVDHR